MSQFLKLIRWPNLVIILLSMVFTLFFVINPLLGLQGFEAGISFAGFVLLVLATLFIAVGGYLINDFFDMDIDRIYDLVALRIICNTVDECYRVLGIIHSLYKPMTGRVKDYIAQPKPNGYKSLHTTVYSDKKIVEFQIRTKKMDEEAEWGIAAHWTFKGTGGRKIKIPVDQEKLKWIKTLLDQNSKDYKPEEYLDKIKMDFFKNRIFVFTPKGDVIDLPEGATPIDFAYSIHSGVGDSCSGAKVNDKMVSLDYKLQNGEICEIITAKNRKPSRGWLQLANTSYAKNRIRSYLKRELGVEVPRAPKNSQKIKNFEFKIIASDRIGMLKDLLSIFQSEKINIIKLNTDSRNKKRPVIIIVFPTKSNIITDQLAVKIKKVKGVKNVEKILLKN